MHYSHILKSFGECHSETFNNALNCHDCHLTWTGWPVYMSSKSYHYNEMSSFFSFFFLELSWLCLIQKIFYQMDVREKCQGYFPIMTLSFGLSLLTYVNSVFCAESSVDTGQRREENANRCFYLRLQIKNILTLKGNSKYDGGCAGL